MPLPGNNHAGLKSVIPGIEALTDKVLYKRPLIAVYFQFLERCPSG
jgi:hypothetical protein